MDDALQKQEKYKTHDNSEFSRPSAYELILFRFVEDEHIMYYLRSDRIDASADYNYVHPTSIKTDRSKLPQSFFAKENVPQSYVKNG
jgi:hypothetical protein